MSNGIADEVLTKCRRCGGAVIRDLQDDSICLMCGERYYAEPTCNESPVYDFKSIHHHKPGTLDLYIYDKKRRNVWRAHGLCPSCGRERYKGYISCHRCLMKYRRHNLKRKVAKEKEKELNRIE